MDASSIDACGYCCVSNLTSGYTLIKIQTTRKFNHDAGENDGIYMTLSVIPQQSWVSRSMLHTSRQLLKSQLWTSN